MVGSEDKLKEEKMRDYIKRFLIAIIIGFCVSLLFLGGKHSEVSMPFSKLKISNSFILNK
jgi:hypothetical protein